jgi:hypothetical protein
MKMKRKSNQEIFKCYENPSFLIINIQNSEIVVKITFDEVEGLRFIIEFTYGNKPLKKILEKISTQGKIYNSDEIEFEGIELLPIDKEKIAHCLNEILDFNFS